MPCKITHAAVRILGATGLLLWAASALASCPVIQSTGLSCEPIDSPAARLMSQNPLCADATRARNGHQPQMFGAIKDRTFKEGGDEVAGWVMSRDMAAGQRFIGLRDSANADDYAAAVARPGYQYRTHVHRKQPLPCRCDRCRAGDDLGA